MLPCWRYSNPNPRADVVTGNIWLSAQVPLFFALLLPFPRSKVAVPPPLSRPRLWLESLSQTDMCFCYSIDTAVRYARALSIRSFSNLALI